MNPTDNPDVVEVKILIHKNSLYPGELNKQNEIIW
jgi:hypothetical protein